MWDWVKWEERPYLQQTNLLTDESQAILGFEFCDMLLEIPSVMIYPPEQPTYDGRQRIKTCSSKWWEWSGINAKLK